MQVRRLAAAAAMACAAASSTPSWSPNYQSIDPVSPNPGLQEMTAGDAEPGFGDTSIGGIPYRIAPRHRAEPCILHRTMHEFGEPTQVCELRSDVFGATEVYALMSTWGASRVEESPRPRCSARAAPVSAGRSSSVKKSAIT